MMITFHHHLLGLLPGSVLTTPNQAPWASPSRIQGHGQNPGRNALSRTGFSNPTKVQEGRDQPRKDIMKRRRGRALSEGCHERKKAQTVVSSREKMNNNKTLVRATTKSKSEMQTVSNGRVG